MARRSKANRQTEFEFPTHGGARTGAGRKRSTPKPRVAHVARGASPERYPVHVTLTVRRGLPTLRETRAHDAILGALRAGAQREGFGLVEYSAQLDHLHLICEVVDRRSLTRAMVGLSVRVARALNRAWGRSGPVFADRYHERALRTPREVWNALRYVFGNARHHGYELASGIDPCSSARWFHGEGPSPLAVPRTWLLTSGWRLWGPIEVE
jgi:REP element-mobilizing transposase RayT